MDNFGLLTLIPPVVIIVFALATKRTFEALLLGAVIGFFMTDKWNVLGADRLTASQLRQPTICG